MRNHLASRAAAVLAPLALLLLPAGAANAEIDYPTRPVRVVVPYAAGGGPDVTARYIFDRVSQVMGQPFVVENRTGASGVIGAEIVVRAPKDGHTLLATPPAPIVILPHIRPLSYDPRRDLVPVAIMSVAGGALAVTNSLPVRNWQEFVAYAHANRGKLSYASSGIGSYTHLRNAMIDRLADLGLQNVPYKGTGEAFADLIAGNIQMMTDTGLLNVARSGKVRLLLVLDRQRDPDFPDIPTIYEAGLDFKAEFLSGIYAPAGTPTEIVHRLNEVINAVGREPEMIERMRKAGNRQSPETPEEFAAIVQRQYETYKELVSELNIKIEQ